MKIINCEKCFTSLPVNEGSFCNIMCSDCGWTPDCDDGQEINNYRSSYKKDYYNVKKRSIKATCKI